MPLNQEEKSHYRYLQSICYVWLLKGSRDTFSSPLPLASSLLLALERYYQGHRFPPVLSRPSLSLLMFLRWPVSRAEEEDICSCVYSPGPLLAASLCIYFFFPSSLQLSSLDTPTPTCLFFLVLIPFFLTFQRILAFFSQLNFFSLHPRHLFVFQAYFNSSLNTPSPPCFFFPAYFISFHDSNAASPLYPSLFSTPILFYTSL